MYKKHLLKNGMRVILVPRKSTEVLTSLVLVRTGSICESEENAGISHLVEHMIYKGSEKRPTPSEVANFIESIGGEHNAFTSKLYTGYYVKVAKEFWKDSLDFLSDNVLHPLFLSEELEKEKAVILEEIKMYQDIPAEVSEELYDRVAFGDTNLGRQIIGYDHSVLAIDRHSLKAYYEEYYNPSNCVLVLAGNWGDEDETLVLEIIERYFDFSATIKASEYTILPSPRYAAVVRRKAEQSNVIVGFAAPGIEDDEWYSASLVAKILGGGMGSRMFQEIREKLGLAYRVGSGVSSFLNAGTLATSAGVSNQNWLMAMEAIIQQYHLAAERGFAPEELDRAKRMKIGSKKIDMEDSEELAFDYGIEELLRGKIITPQDEILAYQNVTLEETKKFMEKYFDFSKIMYSAVGPEVDVDQAKSHITT